MEYLSSPFRCCQLTRATCLRFPSNCETNARLAERPVLGIHMLKSLIAFRCSPATPQKTNQTAGQHSYTQGRSQEFMGGEARLWQYMYKHRNPVQKS
jgi:hypothetical protein